MENQEMITAEMGIADVVSRYPATFEVFMRHGLGCVGCAAARFEDIRQGAMVHGIDVDALVADLNAAVSQAAN